MHHLIVLILSQTRSSKEWKLMLGRRKMKQLYGLGRDWVLGYAVFWNLYDI